MQRPRLILASHKLAGLSGKVLLVRENALGLARRGWAVTVAAQRLEPELFRDGGVALARIARPPLRMLATAWFTRRVAALARGTAGAALVVGHGESLWRQDVLHVHNAVHRAREAAAGRAWEAGTEPTFARAQRRILERGDFRRVVANSHQVREDLIARYGIAAERIAVIYPGHDPARFRPAACEHSAGVRRELGVGAGELLLGLITSGDFEKRGVRQFLAAMAEQPEPLRARLHAIIVGNEAHPERLRALARRLGLESRVHLLAPRRDVEHLYRALDLYVHPAAFEEFGMSVLEAMACGRAVLTTVGVGASELLSGPARAELLPSNEHEHLRDALTRLCREPQRRAALAEAGLAAARQATWASNVAASEELYDAVWEELVAARAGIGQSRV